MCSVFQTYPVKKSKQMLLPNRPYVDVYQKRFSDVIKNFPINYTILASEIVVLGRVSSVFSGAKFNKVKNTSDTDIFLK